MSRMLFYLGTHRPSHIDRTNVPLFVSARQLRRRKKEFSQKGRIAIDSGGFTELSMFGEWTRTPAEYVNDLNRLVDVGLSPDWASQQDWMVEPAMLEKTGKTVQDHQRLTVANFLELRSLECRVHVIPVIQGWTLSDYEECIRMYEREGVDLTRESTVGVGSVCRRQGSQEILDLMRMVHSEGISAHGFGVKTKGVELYSRHLKSADSMAWSYSARAGKRHCINCSTMPAGPQTKNCANCLYFALEWRHDLLKRGRML